MYCHTRFSPFRTTISVILTCSIRIVITTTISTTLTAGGTLGHLVIHPYTATKTAAIIAGLALNVLSYLQNVRDAPARSQQLRSQLHTVAQLAEYIEQLLKDKPQLPVAALQQALNEFRMNTDEFLAHRVRRCLPREQDGFFGRSVKMRLINTSLTSNITRRRSFPSSLCITVRKYPLTPAFVVHAND